MPIDPATLRPHYSRFLREDRVLLTGHSHQAWPDVAREGLLEAFDDAAAHVDEKWARARAVADEVRAYVGRCIGAGADEIALGQSTHELASRWLSALDLRGRPHLVTTGGEFHSLRRQLARLEEAGLRVSWVPTAPLETLSERLAAAVDEGTAGLALSTVLFETSAQVPSIEVAIEAARRAGAEVLLDAYHAFGVAPLDVSGWGDVFVTAGGYKYAQWGEGCCWMRVPPATRLRPVYTGWFAGFSQLAAPQGSRVEYGRTPAERFAGSTYDPASHYRARRVIRFFEAQRLTLERLRALSLRQTRRLMEGLDGLPVRTPEARGGFVSVELEDAAGVARALRARGIWTDARGRMLRLGPAPYTTEEELDRAIRAVRELAC